MGQGPAEDRAAHVPASVGADQEQRGASRPEPGRLARTAVLVAPRQGAEVQLQQRFGRLEVTGEQPGRP